MQSVGLLHWGGGTFPGGVQICYLLPPFLIFPGLFLAFPCHTGIPCWQTSLRKLPSHEVKDAMSVLRERNHHLRASDLQLQPQVSLYLPCTPKPPPGLVAPLTGSGWEIRARAWATMEAHDRHQLPSVPRKGIARWPGTAVAMGRAAESVLHNLKV